jgi:hypothetical protein
LAFNGDKKAIRQARKLERHNRHRSKQR